MNYLNIERKRNIVSKVFCGVYIFYFVLRCMIHVGYPILFLSVYPYNSFVENTTNYFTNSSIDTVSYDRMFYIYILFQNIFVGVLEFFNSFIVNKPTTGKTMAIVASGGCFYSLLVAFFYLILYYSMVNYDGNDLMFFQYVGFSEIIFIIVWIFLMGIYIMEILLNRSLHIYREASGNIIDGLERDV